MKLPLALPGRRLIVLLLAPAAWLLAWPGPQAVLLAVTWDAVLLVAAAVDLYRAPRTSQLRIGRTVPARLSLGDWNTLEVSLENRSRRSVRLELLDTVPEDFEIRPEPLLARLEPGARARVDLQVRPTRRGAERVGDLHVRWWSPWELVVRQRRVPATHDVRVHASVAELSRWELAARAHRLAELGLTASRQRGRGTLFESLRDYVPGDPPADLAWKATARRGRLITRQFEVDRSQNVLVVLDCGRLMTPVSDGLSRLDHAVNATLLLAHVVARQGDRIGLLGFSDRIEAYVPPGRGRGAVGRIDDALHVLQPRLVEPDHERACRFLGLRHRKRSLIVILTDVVDRNASAPLLAHAARFARHHVSLCVTLRDVEAERLAARPPSAEADVFERAIALRILAKRHEALELMRRHGVGILDVDPTHLTPRLISRYLALKRQLRI